MPVKIPANLWETLRFCVFSIFRGHIHPEGAAKKRYGEGGGDFRGMEGKRWGTRRDSIYFKSLGSGPSRPLHSRRAWLWQVPPPPLKGRREEGTAFPWEEVGVGGTPGNPLEPGGIRAGSPFPWPSGPALLRFPSPHFSICPYENRESN